MSRPCPFSALRALPLALVLLWVGLAEPARTSAQVLRNPDELPPSVYRIGALELSYGTPHPDQPALTGLVPVEVELRKTERGWAAPREGEASETLSIGGPESPVVDLEVSGLARVLAALVRGVNGIGLYGVDVRPAEGEIDLSSEQDLRPSGRSALAIVVHTGRIARIRTVAVGSRVKGDWKIDNSIHDRIREGSPLQPAGEGVDGTTDLLDRRRLEDYLHRLNRHGGRAVEAALSPGEKPGDVVLDYRVVEAKPWYAYAQTTNTGTSRTSPWQSRFGATHTQLTNRDDTLTVEYLNAGLADVNGLSARYDAPFFGPRRPEWMNRRKGDPGWLAWLPREKIPWWGAERLRWGADVSWNRSTAGRGSTLQGLVNDKVQSTQVNAGGNLTYQAFQYRNFFVDLVGGLSFSDLRVENDSSSNRGEALLVLPRAGVHAERINALSTFTFDTTFEGQVNSIGDGDLAALGRSDTDERYVTLDFNTGWSAYLEPLLRPEAWRDPENETAATLAHEISVGLRGQYGFDYRLIPQASQTLGGFFSVRGYDQSVAVGDTVVVSTFEYRFHLPRALPIKRQPMRFPLIGDFRVAPQQVYGRPDWDFVLRGFVDAGRAIRNQKPNGNGGSAFEHDQTLVGAGVGAEFLFRSNLRARLDYAFALHGTSGNLEHSTHVGHQALHALVSILY